jgi:3-oxoadipate enol-lactonase
VILPPYAQRALVTQDGAQLLYVDIGTGATPVLLIPGAGDGLNTVDRAALQLAWMYRKRAEQYRTHIVSRRVPFPQGFGLEQQADDFIWLLDELKLGPVILECNSAGGPVGQWIAVKRPDLVRGLVLASTLHRADVIVREKVTQWLTWLRHRQWGRFTWDSIEITYRNAARYRLLRPLMGLLKPNNPDRIVWLLEELLDFDNSAILPQITHPTLVIAGAEDPLCTADIQREMAELIPRSKLVLCPGYRHGNDLENPAYARYFDAFVQGLAA